MGNIILFLLNNKKIWFFKFLQSYCKHVKFCHDMIQFNCILDLGKVLWNRLYTVTGYTERIMYMKLKLCWIYRNILKAVIFVIHYYPKYNPYMKNLIIPIGENGGYLTLFVWFPKERHTHNEKIVVGGGGGVEPL